MKRLSLALQPYKNIVGTTAGIVTVLQFFSGAFVCNDIRKKGSTKGFSSTPFIGGAVLGILSLKFGALLRDEAMIKVNLVGFAINIAYVCFFYFYTADNGKMSVWGEIGLGGAFAIGVLSYAEYEDPKLIEFRFGMIVTGFLICLVASPMLGIKEIFRRQSTEGLPFPIILSGSVVSLMWLIYGVILNNTVIVIQNLIVLMLGVLQLSLFIIFPSKSAPKKKKIQAKKKAN